MRVEEFNALSESDAAELVRVWADVPGWVHAVVAGRPYADAGALAAYAGDLARVWSTADLDAALAHHPRIGERPRGEGAGADASRREQSAMAHAADEVATAIAAGNRAYEERFGRVFLIRAAGRHPEEILAELDRRLASDADAEAREATAQLAEIALLRLRAAFDDDPGPIPAEEAEE